jgi:hypothetical protein
MHYLKPAYNVQPMKNTTSYTVLSIALLSLAFASCSKKSSTEEAEVVITSISPATAKGGDIIKITGRNLLKDISNTTVLLNGVLSEKISAEPDSIKVKVPLKAGSGTVVVKVSNKEYIGPVFTYNYKVTVTTIAGTGSVGNSDGTGLQSSFNCPWGITANKNGDLFVADCYNRLIRKLSAPNFSVSTYTIPVLINGKNFYSPNNISIDTATQNVYVTDFNEHVMKMDRFGSMDVIYIDTMPLAGIAVNPSGTNLFISNNTKGTVIRTDMNGQNRSVFTTGLITPRNIFFNRKGQMFVTAYPGPIYSIDNNGKASNIGNGATFGGWEAIADTAGNFFLADHFNNCLRMIDKLGNAKVIAGSGLAADVDGIGLNASFDGPQGITIDGKGDLYITTYNYDKKTGNKVRKVVIE